MPTALSAKAIRNLRALGHPLKPLMQLGKEGVTDAFVAAVSEALERHELIKVKILSEAPVERFEAAEDLATQTRSTLAQVIGRVVLLYRRRVKKPKIDPERGTMSEPEKPKKASSKPQRRKKRPSKPAGRGERSFETGPSRARKPGRRSPQSVENP